MSQVITKTGMLKHGLKVGERVHKEFELREALSQDLFDAESDATADTPTKFRAALLVRQLVRVDQFEGPFTLQMLGRLKAVDLARLLNAQRELDQMGEDEQPG